MDLEILNKKVSFYRDNGGSVRLGAGAPGRDETPV